MALHGSCMCGATAYVSDCMPSYYLPFDVYTLIHHAAPPLLSALCHCIDCQKWTGGAFTSNVVVPRTSFKVTKGAPKSCDIVGESGKNNRHFFCADCGSSLFTELDVMDDKTVIKAGTLDHGEANLREKVNLEFYVKDRVPYLGAVPDAKQELRLG